MVEYERIQVRAAEIFATDTTKLKRMMKFKSLTADEAKNLLDFSNLPLCSIASSRLSAHQIIRHPETLGLIPIPGGLLALILIWAPTVLFIPTLQTRLYSRRRSFSTYLLEVNAWPERAANFSRFPHVQGIAIGAVI
jgi:hypothetical protein